MYRKPVVTLMALLYPAAAMALCEVEVCLEEGCQYSSLGDALYELADDCTVNMGPGTYLDYSHWLSSHDVTIQRDPARSGDVIIDTTNESSESAWMWVGATGFTLRDVTVKLGTDSPGIQLADYASAVLDDVAFEGGGAYSNGGAHVELGYSAQMSTFNCSFEGGTSATSGAGSILVGNDAYFADTDSGFSGNTAFGAGGAIQVMSGAYLSLTGTSFSGNASTSGGGAMGANAAFVLLDGVSMAGNDGGFFGGAIYIQGIRGGDDYALVTSRTTFTDNEARSGGAVYGSSTSLAFNNGDHFSGNDATGVSSAGGAVHLNYGSELLIANADVSSNTAHDGGGLYVVGSSDLSVSNVTFDQNNADRHGGAIAVVLGDSASFTDNTYDTNTAGSDGGAWYVSQTSSVLSAVEIATGNTAGGVGGFGVLHNVSMADVTDSFIENGVAEKGGALAVSGISTYVEIASTRFCHNEATGFAGGAIFVDSGETGMSVRNSLFVENFTRSSGTGGAIHSDEPELWLDQNHFLGNSSTTGVAIYSFYGDVSAFGNLFAYSQSGSTAVDVTEASVLDYNLFYDNGPFGTGHANEVLPHTNLLDIDPLLIDYGPDNFGDACDDSIFKPYNAPLKGEVSPLVDAYVTAYDHEGSAADIGSFGGESLPIRFQLDNDKDGVDRRYDCNDLSSGGSAYYPDQVEVCDGVDNDCDQLIDDADPGVEAPLWYLDGDGDGYAGATVAGLVACEDPSNEDDVFIHEDDIGTDDWDCDDVDDGINPGETEVCDDDGLDEDCSGDSNDDDDDLDPSTATYWYEDADKDGYGTLENVEIQCVKPTVGVWRTNDDDCDDENDQTYPGADEVCDDKDNDCDELVDDLDSGDDDDGGVKAEEGGQQYWPDSDKDGFGAKGEAGKWYCLSPGNKWTTNGDTDCVDTDKEINELATEVCDGADNDCDGYIDDDDSYVAEDSLTAWFPDKDEDGFGNPVGGTEACAKPTGKFVADDNADCDDQDDEVNPDGVEICDDIDNDCNDKTDDGLTKLVWEEDNDQDGYGDNTQTKSKCDEPDGNYVLSGGEHDCDDEVETTYPDAPDTECAGVDSDCNDDGGADFDMDGDTFTYTEEVAQGSDPCSDDSDNDGITDDKELDEDTDGDGTPNILDDDDDGDGIDTKDEAAGDPDDDGLENYLDTDSDNDGWLDSVEQGDLDNDGIPDVIDDAGDANGDEIAKPDPGSFTSGFGFGCSQAPGPASGLLMMLALAAVRTRRTRVDHT
jgi:predicted outer membrane repeat protein